MKKLATLVMAATFALGAYAACGNPCEKVADKAIECTENSAAKDVLKKNKEKSIKACKASEDLQKKAKKCADISDCKKFTECLADK